MLYRGLATAATVVPTVATMYTVYGINVLTGFVGCSSTLTLVMYLVLATLLMPFFLKFFEAFHYE